jgi:5-methyltetrahydrofolate--homocysteine methyltransferase
MHIEFTPASLVKRLRAGEVLLADGAMGTQLMARGMTAGRCPEAYNLDEPAMIEAIAAAYRDAGADILQTNTFGGNPLRLARHALDGRTEEVNAAAVAVARRAAEGRAYVAASIGPTGRILKPYGDTDPADVAAAYQRQLRAVAAAGGVDLVLVETMTDLAEAVAVVRAARDAMPDVPVAATLTFEATKRGFRTIMGTTVSQAVQELTAAGAAITGANCGNGIETMVRVAAEFRACTGGLLLIQANAGLPEIRDGRPVWPETPEFYAEKAAGLLELGVNIIGGCCGTTPAHIAALRRLLGGRAHHSGTENTEQITD